MPRSLLGRSLIILITPLILVQLILGYVFLERHTEAILNTLANSIAGDIQLLNRMMDHGYPFQEIKTLAHQNLYLNIHWLPGQRLEQTGVRKHSWLYTFMEEALVIHLTHPSYLSMDKRWISIDIQRPEGILQVKTPRSRLFSRTTPRVLIWTTLSGILLLVIASLFMRNQIKPIRRLSEAAASFGKGHDQGDIRSEGATEVRKAAEAFNDMRHRILRQIHERTEMLAGVSHDLRTPLTRLHLQLAMMPQTEEIQELLAEVKEMTIMLEGFLTFARGAGNEPSESTNLVKLLQEVVKPFQKTGFPILFNTPQDLILPLKPLMMKRCLTNLLLNAQRYAQRAWISLQEGKEVVTLWIDDDGPGIPKRHYDTVFRPFFRLDPSRNPQTGGVGLGLSIVRDAIHCHGGEVTLLPSPYGHKRKKGLRVQITLPK